MLDVNIDVILTIRNLAVTEEYQRLILGYKSKYIVYDKLEKHWYCDICKTGIQINNRKESKDFIYKGITQCNECGSVCIMDKTLSCYLEEIETLDNPKISKIQKLKLIKSFLSKNGMDIGIKDQMMNDKKLFRSLKDFHNNPQFNF
jgi:hypothetical protein